jgi:hypothetical protein
MAMSIPGPGEIYPVIPLGGKKEHLIGSWPSLQPAMDFFEVAKAFHNCDPMISSQRLWWHHGRAGIPVGLTSHLDLSNPNREVWEFLEAFSEQYDASGGNT